MSTLRVNEISARTGAGDIAIPSGNRIVSTEGGAIAAPGMILQVVNTTIYTPTAVGLSGETNFVDVPSLTATITPKSASSKIYVTSRWFGETSGGNVNWDVSFGLKRNGTVIGQNPSSGGRNGISMAALSYYVQDGNSTPEMMYLDFYDTPSTTSATTYQVYAVAYTTATTLYTNRTVTASTANYEYGSSTITLWEIA